MFKRNAKVSYTNMRINLIGGTHTKYKVISVYNITREELMNFKGTTFYPCSEWTLKYNSYKSFYKNTQRCKDYPINLEERIGHCFFDIIEDFTWYV